MYEELCPEQSRFLMGRWKALNVNRRPRIVYSRPRTSQYLPEGAYCPFCLQWRRPDNHRVRVRPKRRASARVQAVLRREGRGKRLSLAQSELLRRYRKAPSYLMATCHTCNKTTRHNGVNRELLASLSRSHNNKRKTPQSSNMATPKSASKEKTPSSTPRSNSTDTTASSTSTKSSGGKKSTFSRLKKFFLLEDSQKKKTKGGLKDFLSSL